MPKIPENQPILFPDWVNKLPRLNLASEQLAEWQSEIFAFLRHCRQLRTPVTATLARLRQLEGYTFASC